MASKHQLDESNDSQTSSDDTLSLDLSNGSDKHHRHIESKTLKFIDPLKEATFDVDVSEHIWSEQ
jgi:hypothetical protein